MLMVHVAEAETITLHCGPSAGSWQSAFDIVFRPHRYVALTVAESSGPA